ncbi:helix-turn-helix domain-containing protein [Micromonospora zhanjiangensis]
MLKYRSGRGFEWLGRQARVSGSSVHRYCSGLSVPSDYRVVHSFAKACGASPEEMRSVHRLWALADASRDAIASPSRPNPPTRDLVHAGRISPDTPPAAAVASAAGGSDNSRPGRQAVRRGVVLDGVPRASAPRTGPATPVLSLRHGLLAGAAICVLVGVVGVWALRADGRPGPAGRD